jgi:putative membrane protein insertion efficiency factor
MTVSVPEVDSRPLSGDQGASDGDQGALVARPPGPVAKALLAAVRAYQAARWGRPTGCRFVPTCSAYAAGAIERHGAVSGSWLAVKRLARCHPWGGHGVDPVPDRRVPCWPH